MPILCYLPCFIEICLLNFIHVVRETDDHKTHKRNDNLQTEQTLMKFGNKLGNYKNLCGGHLISPVTPPPLFPLSFFLAALRTSSLFLLALLLTLPANLLIS